MALLDTLATELLGPKSTKELCKGTDAKPEQVQQVVTAALPLLVSGMFQNSGTADGAASLAKALDHHAPSAKTSTSAMLKEADAEDGKKIVQHILGDQETAITEGLSRASGLSSGQTLKILCLLAPVVMALMGKFKQDGQGTQTAAQTQASAAGMTGLLGSALLGSGFQQVQPAQQSGLNLSSIAGALLGGGSTQQATASSAGSSLLSGLLGGGLGQAVQQVQPVQQAQTQSSGINLSGLLMGLLK